MQYSVVASRIADLPPPFTRPDSNYAAVQASLSYALTQYCQPADSTDQQTNYGIADGGWLNVWGQLLGLPRYPSEADSVYQARVLSILIAPVGSALAIQTFATSFFHSSVTVTENFPGYTVAIPSFASVSQIDTFAVALGRIRPAGVPIIIEQIQQSFFFNNYNYFNGQGIAGVYFGGPPNFVTWPLPINTNNSQSLLPSLLLTDPVLNGQISI